MSDFGLFATRDEYEDPLPPVYVPPEMSLNQPCEGEKHDIFVAGVIVFIMVAKHPPFGSATPKDPYYKCLAASRDDIFWKNHCKNKENGVSFFSDDFKDLFSKMVQLDPSKRLSIDSNPCSLYSASRYQVCENAQPA